MGALALVGGGAAASGFGITAVAYGYFLVSPWFRGKDAIVARLPLEDGTALPLTRWDLRVLRFGLGHSGSDCVLDTQLGPVLQGEAAQVGLNRWGGKEETRRSAVSLLEEAREPARYVQRLADRSRGETIRALPPSERLALEMAVNEEAEGRALGRELRLLELAWKEAEEIATIADGVLVPPELERKIAEWRSRHGGDARAGGQGSQRSHFAQHRIHASPGCAGLALLSLRSLRDRPLAGRRAG